MYCVSSRVKGGPISDELRKGGRNDIVRALEEEKVQMAGITVR